MKQESPYGMAVFIPLGLLLPLLGLAGCAEMGQVMEKVLERGLSVQLVLGVISAISLIVALVGLRFKIIPVMDQTRKEFEARRPNVRLERAYCISAGGSYAAVLRVQNMGKTPAADGLITLDGWPGKAEFGILLNECEKSIEIGQADLVRTTWMHDARLWIRYRDQWGDSYRVSYPVLQQRGDHGLFDLQIQKDQPRQDRPRVSFRRMRKILRETPG